MVRSGDFSTPADQRRLVRRLRQQDVPLALVLSDSDAARSVVVMGELESEFLPVVEIPIDGEESIAVRVNRRGR